MGFVTVLNLGSSDQEISNQAFIDTDSCSLWTVGYVSTRYDGNWRNSGPWSSNRFDSRTCGNVRSRPVPVLLKLSFLYRERKPFLVGFPSREM